MESKDNRNITPKKRKRSGTTLQPNHLPSDSINPFSHTPSQLLQFVTAGLTHRDRDPASSNPLFPHRSLSPTSGIESDDQESDTDDTENGGEEIKTKKGKARGASRRERQVLVLVQTIHQFLATGEIKKAARAYSLVLHLQPNGTTVDLRRHHLWAIGGEILMREGERSPAQPSPSSETSHASQSVRRTQRWGSADNMGRVKAYFETLIRQYPYEHRHPFHVSALDFWLALFGWEIYNAHIEHVIALESLEPLESLDQDNHDSDMDMLGEEKEEEEEEEEAKEDLGGNQSRADRVDLFREKTYQRMKDIIKRMDDMKHYMPYSKNHAFLKLYATAALYSANLILPSREVSSMMMQQAHERRERGFTAARNALQTIYDDGGDLDAVSLNFLDPDDDPEVQNRTMHTSLPIRQG